MLLDGNQTLLKDRLMKNKNLMDQYIPSSLASWLFLH